MLRTIARTIGGDDLRAIAALGATYVVIGASFGAVAIAAGLPWWLPSLMSVVVFAGASQFLFVAVLLTGAGPAAAAVAGIVVNLRLAPLSLSVRRALGTRRGTRLLGAHLVTDESVAFALAARGDRRRRTTFRVSGVAVLVAWNAGVALGASAGPVLGDGSALGLDAAFPALLTAVLLGGLRETGSRSAALAGAGIGLAATPLLPAGIPVLAAVLGGSAGIRRRAARPTGAPAAGTRADQADQADAREGR